MEATAAVGESGVEGRGVEGRLHVEGPASLASGPRALGQCSDSPETSPSSSFLLSLFSSSSFSSTLSGSRGFGEVAMLGNSPMTAMGVWPLACLEVLGEVVRALTLELG